MPDMAFQLFSIIKDAKLAIQINRYGAAMTQIFPLIGLKLNLSLKTIAILYSISFPIVYLILFCFINFVLKQPKIGFIYFLFHFLINTHSFYWPQCELIQGASLLLVYLAYLEYYFDKKQFNYLFWILSIAQILLIIYTYPLLIVPFIFSVGFLYLNRKNQWEIYLSQICIFSSIFIIKNLFLKNYYDSGALSGLKNFKTIFPNYFTTVSNQNFLNYLIKDYYLLIPIFLISNFYYYFVFNQKKIVFWINAFFLGLILLINVSYQQGAEQFYLEGQYSILCIIVGFPFVYLIFNIFKLKFKSFFIAAILMFFVFRISNSHSIYTKRIELYRSFISKFDSEKIILKSSITEYQKTLKFIWGSAYEIWLLSTIENKKTSSIILKNNPEDIHWAMKKNKSFFTEYEIIDYAKLNPSYFVLKDTNLYKIIK
jgi:hypothetical protein